MDGDGATIGARLRVLRRWRGMTLTQLADHAELSPSFLSRCERGLNAGIIALIRPLPIDTPTRAFYLPIAAATVLALCAVLLTRRLSRWAGLTLLLVYAAFLAGGFILYGAAATNS